MNLLVLVLVEFHCCCYGAAGQTDGETCPHVRVEWNSIVTNRSTRIAQSQYVLVILEEIGPA